MELFPDHPCAKEASVFCFHQSTARQARRQRRETPQHHHSASKTTRPFQKTASLILVHIIIKTNQAWAIWITSPGFRHAGGKFGGSQWKYDSDGLRSMATFVI